MVKPFYLLNICWIFLLIAFNSCVSKSEYETQGRELESTKQELLNIQDKYREVMNEKIQSEIQSEIEKNKLPVVTEAQALKYIKDHYSFYDRDTKFRKVKLRRITDNSFKVALETCTTKGDFSNNDFFWRSEVRTLTVQNNGKYDFN